MFKITVNVKLFMTYKHNTAFFLKIISSLKVIMVKVVTGVQTCALPISFEQ